MKLVALAVTAAACFRPVPPTGPTHEPVPIAMEQTTALGTWRSSWGELVLKPSPSGTIVGRWSYTRGNEQHAGELEGKLDGNVLRFTWNATNPTTYVLGGHGWIAFDPREPRFRGEWWTPPFRRSTPIGDGRGYYRKGYPLEGVVTGQR